jgi:hypothetical protein
VVKEHFQVSKAPCVPYVKSLNKLFVASGDDGMLRIFRAGHLPLETL